MPDNEKLIENLEAEIAKNKDLMDYYLENKIDVMAEIYALEMKTLQVELETLKKNEESSRKLEADPVANVEDATTELFEKVKSALQRGEIKKIDRNSSSAKVVKSKSEAQEENPVQEMLDAMNEVKTYAAEIVSNAEAQANIIKAKINSDYQKSIDSLKSYQDNLQKSGLHEKKWIFRSNKVEKLAIVAEVIVKLNEANPADLDDLKQLQKDLKVAIEKNMKATGLKLWNRGGDLNKQLNNTLKMIDEEINVLENKSTPPGARP